MTVTIVRVYEQPECDRVFVDRLWPRGIRKTDPRIGDWCKDVAPTGELRTWYHHNPDQYELFCARYREELQSGTQAAALAELRARAADHDIELATASRTPSASHVPVIAAEIAGD